MSEDVQFDTCSTCGHVYRPAMEESVSGHRVATGHAPTPAREERPDLSHLLIVAARRIGELEDELADARRALDEIRPVVEHVDNDEVWDGTYAEILRRGFQRLEDVVDGLEGLAISWEQFTTAEDRPGLLRAARMLRDYLERPPIHAQDQEAADG